MVKLFLKNSNLCDHDSPTSQTDRQTTCDRNTALCTRVHRAVKTTSIWYMPISCLRKKITSNYMQFRFPFASISCSLHALMQGQGGLSKVRRGFDSLTQNTKFPQMWNVKMQMWTATPEIGQHGISRLIGLKLAYIWGFAAEWVMSGNFVDL